MVCSKCGHFTSVLEIRHNRHENLNCRIRKCISCGYKFYTTEQEVEFNDTIKKAFSDYRNGYGRKRNKRSTVKKVAVRCVDTGEVFDSISDAAEHIHINRSAICSCCKGRLKTAGGMKWEYYNKNEKEQEE